MKRKFKVLLLSFISFFLIAAKSYSPVEGLSFDSSADTMLIEGLEINYELHIQKSKYSEEWLSANLRATSEKLLKYAKTKKYRTIECRPVANLGIYTVKENTLNNRERFNDYDGAETGDLIWGLFDGRGDEYDSSAIILSDQGKKNNLDIFSHELAHYWAYRFCWDFYYSDIKDEDIANDFEKYAREN